MTRGSKNSSRPRGAGFLADRTAVVSVEFAVTFLLVIVTVLGIFEVCFIFLAQRGIDRGVVEASRWVAMNSSTATPATVKPIFVAASTLALGSTTAATCTVAFAAPTASASGCVINVVFSGAGQVVEGTVTVTAQYTWVPLTTLVSIGTMTLISSAAMTIQD